MGSNIRVLLGVLDDRPPHDRINSVVRLVCVNYQQRAIDIDVFFDELTESPVQVDRPCRLQLGQ